MTSPARPTAAAGPAPTVGDVVAALEQRYPPAWPQDWDRVGLVLGEPAAAVRRVLCVVDCVPETVAEALAEGADFIVAALAGRVGRLARRHPGAGGGGLRPRHRPVDSARPI